MTVEPWAIRPSLEMASEISRIAKGLELTPSQLLGAVAVSIVRHEKELQRHGLSFARFRTITADPLDAMAIYATDVLQTDVKPSGRTWPTEVPFAWTGDHCKAAVLGYQVRWPGDRKTFEAHIPGKWSVNAADFCIIDPR